MRVLHIHHLFTPSGLHLASLLWFFSLFSLKRVALLLFLPFVIFADGFFAFKRVYFIRAVSELLQMKGVFIKSRHVFFFVFAVEFIFRAQLNPLSFTYSFLFLGIIYSLAKSSPSLFIGWALVWTGTDCFVHRVHLFIFFHFP